jgi:hypothetical protein
MCGLSLSLRVPEAKERMTVEEKLGETLEEAGIRTRRQKRQKGDVSSTVF